MDIYCLMLTVVSVEHDPVSSEMSDFTSCTDTQSNILHTKCADKSDYEGLGIRV